MNQTVDEMKMVHEDEMKNYDRIQAAVLSVMVRHGCRIIQTPTFEEYDTYGRYFPALRKEMIKIIDTDGSVLVLQPDVTAPLVRTVAREYPDPAQLLKFGYVSTVFREYYGKSTHGKYFLQSGVELLGDPTPECDGEVMVMAAEFLEALGIHNMRIDLGTVAYMDALFAALSLPEETMEAVRLAVEKRNLVTFDALVSPLALSPREKEALLALPRLFGDYEETMKKARALCLNEKMEEALNRLEQVYAYFKYAGYEKLVQLDFGFTSHMGYYTDLVFKIYVDGALYSIVNGGRYDALSAQFGVSRPACGFGLNMNLLYEYMADAGLLGKVRPSIQLAVAYDHFDPELVRDLTEWRKKKFSVLGYHVKNTVRKEDYEIAAVYRDGQYIVNGKSLSKEEMEALLRRL